MRFPHSVFLSKLNRHNCLNLSSQGRCSSPLIVSVALLWTHSNSSTSFLYHGPQALTQYSRWGLTKAEGNTHHPLLAATPLLMQPRIQLAFQAARAHCWIMSRFLSISTPTFISSGLLSRSSSPSQYSYLRLPRSKCNTLHLALLNLFRFSCAQSLSHSRSLWMGSFCCVNCTTQLGVISKLAKGTFNSTVCIIDKGVEEHWPYDHWVTSLVTNLHLDIELLTTTLWLQPSNQLFIHLIVQPSHSSVSNLEIRMLCGTTSKHKSKWTISVAFLLSTNVVTPS